MPVTALLLLISLLVKGIGTDDWMLNAARGDQLAVRGDARLCVDSFVIVEAHNSGLRIYRLPASWR